MLSTAAIMRRHTHFEEEEWKRTVLSEQEEEEHVEKMKSFERDIPRTVDVLFSNFL